MPPMKRKAADDEDLPSSSGDHEKKLRSDQQELPSENSIIPTPLKLPDDECKKYTIKYPYPQRFSVPENIIYYIARNPKNLQCHQKVLQTCKALIRMSRIIPLKDAQDGYQLNQMNITVKLKSNKETHIFLNNQFFKFWIYGKLDIYGRSQKFATTLLKHVYQFELKELSLKNQFLTFAELQILVDGGQLEKVTFIKNSIKKVDDFGKIFDAIFCKDMYMSVVAFLWDRIHEFQYVKHGSGGWDKDKATKIAEILESRGNEYSIKLSNIPQNFDINVFFAFLKANMHNRQHTISIRFADTISEDYKNRLQQMINEIIQIRGIYAHTVPYIYFSGQNAETKKQLQKMRNEPVEGILRKP